MGSVDNFRFQRSKNFQSQLRVDEVNITTLVGYASETQYMSRISVSSSSY